MILCVPFVYVSWFAAYVLVTGSSIYFRVHGGLIPASLTALGVGWGFLTSSQRPNSRYFAAARTGVSVLLLGLMVHGAAYAARKAPYRGWESVADVIDLRATECKQEGRTVSLISTYCYDEWLYPLISARQVVSDFGGTPGESLTILFCSSHQEMPEEDPPHLRAFYPSWERRKDIWKIPEAWATKRLVRVNYYAVYEHTFDVVKWSDPVSEYPLLGIICVRLPGLSSDTRDNLLTDALLSPEFLSVRVLVGQGAVPTVYLPFQGRDARDRTEAFARVLLQDTEGDICLLR